MVGGLGPLAFTCSSLFFCSGYAFPSVRRPAGASMANAFRPLTILSWNVRGLGDKRKCDNVRLAFPCPLPSISCLQETKLTAIDQFKAASILPRPLSSSFNFKPSSGSSGGLLTAWDPNHLVLLSYPTDRYSITTSFRSTAANTEFAVTNCYGPCVHAEKQAVLEELISLYSSISGPWVLLGDFNLIRSPAERSNDNFDSTESGWFNNAIDAMALQELTLTDRRFTWSNHQEEPILAMLDRFLVSTEWSLLLPNSAVSSRSAQVSDHCQLLLTARTRIPQPSIFRFDNFWMRVPQCSAIIASHGIVSVLAHPPQASPDASSAAGQTSNVGRGHVDHPRISSLTMHW